MIQILIGAALLVAPAAETPNVDAAPAAEVELLVRQLDAPELTQRDDAERKLLALGPAALPRLPAINDQTPPEVAKRVGRLRQQLLRAQAIAATQVSARFPFNHGAPIHLGDPAAIGADLARPLFGGPVPELPRDKVPVFWACGVTPQAAAENARLPLFIAHAPAHSFITDLPADALMTL